MSILHCAKTVMKDAFCRFQRPDKLSGTKRVWNLTGRVSLSHIRSKIFYPSLSVSTVFICGKKLGGCYGSYSLWLNNVIP